MEIRNRSFLHPEYFAVLRAHGVTHVCNQWTEMPTVEEQMGMEGWERGVGMGASGFLTSGHFLSGKLCWVCWWERKRPAGVGAPAGREERALGPWE